MAPDVIAPAVIDTPLMVFAVAAVIDPAVIDTPLIVLAVAAVIAPTVIVLDPRLSDVAIIAPALTSPDIIVKPFFNKEFLNKHLKLSLK